MAKKTAAKRRQTQRSPSVVSDDDSAASPSPVPRRPYDKNSWALELCDRSDPRCPDYSKEDYPYIRRGFVVPGFKLVKGVYSHYFSPDNESMNCWTQLVGVIIFVWMILTVKNVPTSSLMNTTEYQNVTLENAEQRRFYYELALGSCLVCCLSSLTCHQFQAFGLRTHSVLSICDWSGTLLIALMTCVSTDMIDLEQLVRHHVKEKWLVEALLWSTGKSHLLCVIVALVLTLGTLAVVETTHAFRFSLIFITVLMSALPGIALSFIVRMEWSLLALVSMIVGGIFFGTHFPERFFVGTSFDILMPSHSLWHICYITTIVIGFDTFSVLFFGKSVLLVVVI